jgi:prepilin-type N-terminal cleavage/methylation domain-containing protein
VIFESIYGSGQGSKMVLCKLKRVLIMKKRYGLAFTLVELLVVISIIAVLLSVLLPSLRKARDSAKITVCASNQKQLVTAALLYATANKSQFPPCIGKRKSDGYCMWPQYIGVQPTPFQPYTTIKNYLGSYLSDGKIFACPLSPADQKYFGDGYQNGTGLQAPIAMFWNWQQTKSTRYPTFIGPSSLESANGKTAKHILTADIFVYGWQDAVTGRKSYFSAHRPPDGKSGGKFPPSSLSSKPYAWIIFDEFGSTYNPPPYKNNVGYIDGSVKKVSTKDMTTVQDDKSYYFYVFPKDEVFPASQP